MLSPFAQTIFARTYQNTPTEDWTGCADRVARFVCGDSTDLTIEMRRLITHRKFMPGGRYLYASGRARPQVSNCFLFRCEDSAKGWGDLFRLVTVASTKGGGCGIEYSDVREKGAPISGYGGRASGPLSVAKGINDWGRVMKSGSMRRSALWAGLNWRHPDILAFITSKNWGEEVRERKALNPDYPATLDQTNISVGLDDAFFRDIEPGNSTWDLYLQTVTQAVQTGEPGFSINLLDQAGFNLRNPCCEIVSEDNGDVCNLGSVNMARIKDINEFEEVVVRATEFLYRGTVVGWLPDDEFTQVRNANRRIGLGLMGLHEWCIQRDLPYAPSAELHRWLEVWADASGHTADAVADSFGLPRPKGVRAIAPNGTIGIIAETEGGMEPMATAACKRRYHTDDGWKYQYVVNPTAQRAMERGIEASDIQDAHSLALVDRLAMQACLQGYTDQAISSTINLPAFGTPGNDDPKGTAHLLLQYLPKLRGVTFYPTGARSGQPIEPVSIGEALENADRVFEVEEDTCSGGVCGI